MEHYPKIETIFQRDMAGTKRLMPGVYCNETVEFLKDNQWVFTEKIDGTNIRVCWDGHRVSFGGRKDGAEIPSPLLKKLEELFGGDVNEELFEQKFGEKEVILFGEGYGAGINKGGGNYRNDVGFILFDVLIDGVWLKRPSIEDVAKAFGIDVVPIVGEGTLEDGVRLVLGMPKSTIGTANMEGVVARPKVDIKDRLGERIGVKIKVKDFRLLILDGYTF